jgi:type II secretory ATPase GspE/PulE/Tfp pilus assembly ATPase PilB-like protein/putative methionine-R-sulfoxide reductase with GAF domain
MAAQEAVDNKKVHELEKQLQYNEKLKFVTNRIHAAKNVTEILVQLQSDILSLFDTDRITIYAVDPVKRELYSKHMVGSEVKEIRVALSSASIAGFAARTAKILSIADVYNAIELKRLSPELKFDKSWDQKTGYRSKQMLVVPIIHERQLLGIIQLLNKRSGGPFTKADEKNCIEVARILGIALINQSKMTKTRFDYITANNIISESELKQATSSARELKTDVESVLMENFKVKKEDIGKSLSQFFGCPFVENPNTVVYDRKLLTGLNLGFLKRAYWVPIQSQDGKVTILIDNPRDRKVVDIKSLVRAREYTFQVALKEDVLKVLELMQKGDSKVGGPVTAGGTSGDSLSDILEEMDVKEEGAAEEIDSSDADEHSGAIVRLVNQIIIDGYEKGASDIHIEPSKKSKKTFVRFRVDGTCFKHLEIPLSHSRALSSRLKIMSNLDISERRLPQDGKIKFFYKEQQIELRVATLPTVGGEDVVMRILAASEPMPVEKLNLNKRNLNEFKRIVVKPYGIILVVGPTGSGKTTTLHAAVGHINKPERKIWTAEDPVEITQEGLRQVEVKPKIKFTFATAMRAFLRADPDVILVGEMRDHETAAIGIEASLTGHLVFSTLHTNSAPETITRLIDMDIDPFNFADALLGILAQRLVRILCKKCKEQYHPTQEEFNELVAAYGEKYWPELGVSYTDDLMLYRPKGCHVCNETGYKGRTGLHELLVGTDEMKATIQRKASVEEMRNQAVKDGMRTLYQDGIMKILKGDTDHKQVRSVCIK